MRRPDPRLPRDWLVLLAWLGTTACLVLLGPVAHIRHRIWPRRHSLTDWSARTPDPAAELAQLDRIVERRIWRSKALHVLHADAANAIEAAEDDFEHMLAQCTAVMSLPTRGPVRDIAPETEFVFLPVAA